MARQPTRQEILETFREQNPQLAAAVQRTEALFQPPPYVTPVPAPPTAPPAYTPQPQNPYAVERVSQPNALGFVKVWNFTHDIDPVDLTIAVGRTNPDRVEIVVSDEISYVKYTQYGFQPSNSSVGNVFFLPTGFRPRSANELLAGQFQPFEVSPVLSLNDTINELLMEGYQRLVLTFDTAAASPVLSVIVGSAPDVQLFQFPIYIVTSNNARRYYIGNENQLNLRGAYQTPGTVHPPPYRQTFQ